MNLISKITPALKVPILIILIYRFLLTEAKSDKMLPPSKLNYFPGAALLKLRFVFCHLIIYVRLFSCQSA